MVTTTWSVCCLSSRKLTLPTFAPPAGVGKLLAAGTPVGVGKLLAAGGVVAAGVGKPLAAGAGVGKPLAAGAVVGKPLAAGGVAAVPPAPAAAATTWIFPNIPCPALPWNLQK